MPTPHNRFAARDHGRRRIRRVTGWTSAAAVLASAVLGVVFARSAEATPAGGPEVQHQPGSATPGDDSWRDDGSTVTPPDQPLQPPPAPPAPTRTSQHHNASSGGS
jgi:hypothetical protein